MEKQNCYLGKILKEHFLKRRNNDQKSGKVSQKMLAISTNCSLWTGLYNCNFELMFGYFDRRGRFIVQHSALRQTENNSNNFVYS